MNRTNIRNVRPSWCVVGVDSSGNDPQQVKAIGPRGRAGTLAVDFKVRQHGDPVDPLTVTMIGSKDGQKVAVHVIDVRNGKLLFAEEFAQ